MADLYHILAQLCNQHQITPYRMCKDTGIQPSVMTDLKKGRRQTVKAETAARLANYFGVTVDYLLGKETCSVKDDGIIWSRRNGRTIRRGQAVCKICQGAGRRPHLEVILQFFITGR